MSDPIKDTLHNLLVGDKLSKPTINSNRSIFENLREEEVGFSRVLEGNYEKRGPGGQPPHVAILRHHGYHKLETSEEPGWEDWTHSGTYTPPPKNPNTGRVMRYAEDHGHTVSVNVTGEKAGGANWIASSYNQDHKSPNVGDLSGEGYGEHLHGLDHYLSGVHGGNPYNRESARPERSNAPSTRTLQ